MLSRQQAPIYAVFGSSQTRNQNNRIYQYSYVRRADLRCTPDEIGSPSMDYESNNGCLHGAQFAEALIYIVLADMYLSLLLTFLLAIFSLMYPVADASRTPCVSFDISWRSVRLFVYSCSCCDYGKGIVQVTAGRIPYFLYPPLTPTRQRCLTSAAVARYATSWFRRRSRSIRRISYFLRCGIKRTLELLDSKCGTMLLMNRNDID